MGKDGQDKTRIANNDLEKLKELSHGILSYFEHRQNYCKIEGNLKIILYKDRKTPKRL